MKKLAKVYNLLCLHTHIHKDFQMQLNSSEKGDGQGSQDAAPNSPK